MKQFAVHSVAALAALALAADGATSNVASYQFPAKENIPGCGSSVPGMLGALMPCGDTMVNACLIATNPTSPTDNTPIVACGTSVQIGITTDVQGMKRTIYGKVAGSAPDGTFKDDIKFGMPPLAFQQLCPFACMEGSTFKMCAASPKGCATGQTALDPTITVGDNPTVEGGFEQQTAFHEFAYEFDITPIPTGFEPNKETELTTPDKLAVYIAGAGVGMTPGSDKNCPKVDGKWYSGDLTSSCGYGGRLPCPLIVKDADECFTDKCQSITFYRIGAKGASGFCVGDTCKAMGEITLEFKAVHQHQLSVLTNDVGPRGLLPPAAVKHICPFVCGTYPYGDPMQVIKEGITWVPICVEKASDCVDSKVVPDNLTIPWGTSSTVTVPGSFFATPFIATNWTETSCGAGINSAAGTAAPGLLVLAAAAVVAMYSS